MLVLSRKKFESIMIGDNVEVTVVSIKGNVCRLSICAPPSVKVLRGELRRHHQPEAGQGKAEHGDDGTKT